MLDDTSQIKRCNWVVKGGNQRYHDTEWGVPLHNDRKLLEFLLLDGAQAGLAWSTILNKRPGYRKAFARFNPDKIARYTRADIAKLLNNPDIIRNKQKIESFVNNAQRFLEVRDEFGTFDRYIWQFVHDKTIVHRFRRWSQAPATSRESGRMSQDLKRRGFTFVGPTICYAFMQSVGMVNDHIVTCFRHEQISNM